tara:strand:- start:5022 stop:5345 length:324 start_codon:yes stop_codon:yes gene_type:complete
MSQEEIEDMTTLYEIYYATGCRYGHAGIDNNWKISRLTDKEGPRTLFEDKSQAERFCQHINSDPVVMSQGSLFHVGNAKHEEPFDFFMVDSDQPDWWGWNNYDSEED